MRIIPTDKAELKGFLCALFACGLFLGVVIANQGPRRIKKRVHADLTMPTPMAPSKLLESEAPPSATYNERFRLVSENFKNVDFRNHSYGLYKYPNGSTIDLTLSDGHLSLPGRSGWFALRDVYYKDVSGDAQPEAIVRLSHVTCGDLCNEADLFYIYARRYGRLTTVWQYETGSVASGCSLKSFTAGNRLVLELFGRCPKQETDNPGPGSFVVRDLTFIVFKFDGSRFQQEGLEVVPTAPTSVRNHEPSIRLF